MYSEMTLASINISTSKRDEIDELVRKGFYGSRSEFCRCAIEKFLEKQEVGENAMKVISISISQKDKKKLSQLRHFPSRSEAVRTAIRDYLNYQENQKKQFKRNVVESILSNIENQEQKDVLDEEINTIKSCSVKLLENSTDVVYLIDNNSQSRSRPVSLKVLLEISKSGNNKKITVDLESSADIFLKLNGFGKLHSIAFDSSATLHLQDFVEFLKLNYFGYIRLKLDVPEAQSFPIEIAQIHNYYQE